MGKVSKAVRFHPCAHRKHQIAAYSSRRCESMNHNSMQWLTSMVILLFALCLPSCILSLVVPSKTLSKSVDLQGALAHVHIMGVQHRMQRQLYSVASDDDDDDDADQELNEILLLIGGNLKLNRVMKENDDGGGEEVLSFESKNSRYGLEVIQTQVSVTNGSGLGLVLTEVASGGRPGFGLVLISEVSGNALRAEPAAIQVGDVITAIRSTDHSVRERTTGLNYDGTVKAIGTVKKAVKDGILSLELNRLVARAPIRIEIVHADKNKVVQTIDALAGQNLRQILLLKDITLGICGGEGTCGACLVAVHGGAEHLGTRGGAGAAGGPISKEETLGNTNIHSAKISWRKACQTIIGSDNKAGTVRIQVKTQ